MRRHLGLLSVLVVAVLIAAAPVSAGGGWFGPQRVHDGQFTDPSIVVLNGKAHVAAVGATGLWYLTNKTGSWTRTRLSTFVGDITHQKDGDPIITVDPGDGSLTVVYTRFEPEDSAGGCGVINARFVTNRSGVWSTPRRVGSAPPSAADSACLWARGAVVRDGKLAVSGLVSVFFQPSVVKFLTNVTGSWTLASFEGAVEASLALDGAGKPRIGFMRDAAGSSVRGGCCAVWYARGTTMTGGFVLEKVANVGGWGLPSIAVDSTGRPRMAYAGPAGAVYAFKDASGWHKATVGHGNQDAKISLDDEDGVHLTAGHIDTGPDRGLWYLTNAGGKWAEIQLDTRSVRDLGGLDITLSGIVHIAYQLGLDAGGRVWYLRSTMP